MVRRIPIRAKVAGALVLPLLGVVGVVAVVVSSTDAVERDVSRQASLVSASVGHAGLLGALQDERNLALVQMLGLQDALPLGVDDPAEARAATDAASTALHHSIEEERGRLRDDYSAALGSLTDLARLRDRVDAATSAPGPQHRDEAHDVFAAYTGMLATLFASHDRFSLVVDDAVMRQGDDLVHYGSHATDAAAQLAERLIYLGTGPGGVDTTAEAAEIAELRRDVTRNNTAIEVRSTGEYAGAFDVIEASQPAQALPALALVATTTPGPVDPRAVLSGTPVGPDGGYAELRASIVEQLDGQADDLEAGAAARRRAYLGVAVAVVGAALLVAWLVSRSIARPLADLSVHARAVATYRLPAAVHDILAAPPGEDLAVPEVEPARIRSRDEVSDVARAFDDVQRSALDLAVEQAALRRNVAEAFVNLGRRNQNLLGRLLDVVGEIEGDEREPAGLARIHRLGHLATRIRRNAESLLVLSGAAPQASWQQPTHVADVVRSAQGEVENYERVVVRTLEPVMVLGNASSDVSHLLAELIENGLRHSPPREPVEVSGARTPQGYTITIADHGLGMTPDEIDRANRRLAGTEAVTATPARYLGHHVTAVLAARHGIRVRLRGSVVVGIAAVVELPDGLVTDRIDALPAGDPLPPVTEPQVVRLPPPPRGRPDLEVVEPEVVEHPSPAEVRTAVAVLRGRQPRFAAPAPPAPPLPAPAPPVPTGPEPAAPVRPEPPAASGPWPVTSPSARPVDPRRPGPEAESPPARTASGLERRVRGANVPLLAATAWSERSGSAAVGSDEASSEAIDGEGIQQFLTELVSGVQRSLDERDPGDRGRQG